jgi:hypothetical protein
MGGAAALVARGTLGAHFLCAPSLPAGLLSPFWLRKPLERPARRTPPRHPSGMLVVWARKGGFSMLICLGGFGFRGIMRRMLGLLRSGGILRGMCARPMGGGLGMSLRFFGLGCGRGMYYRRLVRAGGVGMSCIRRILL